MPVALALSGATGYFIAIYVESLLIIFHWGDDWFN